MDIRGLVVDDEPMVLKLVTSMLEEQFHITIANSGKQALELCLATEQAFDFVLSDVMMPGMDGRELAKRLARHGIETPVVFMTGFSDSFDGDDKHVVIPKPFTSRQLIAGVESVLEVRQLSVSSAGA